MMKYLKNRFSKKKKISKKGKDSDRSLKAASESNCYTESEDSSELENPLGNGKSSELHDQSELEKSEQNSAIINEGSGEVCNTEDKVSMNPSELAEPSSEKGGSSELRKIYLKLLQDGYFDRITHSGLGGYVDSTFMTCNEVEETNLPTFDSNHETSSQAPGSLGNVIDDRRIENNVNEDELYDNNTVCSSTHETNSCVMIPETSHSSKTDATMLMNNEQLNAHHKSSPHSLGISKQNVMNITNTSVEGMFDLDMNNYCNNHKNIEQIYNKLLYCRDENEFLNQNDQHSKSACKLERDNELYNSDKKNVQLEMENLLRINGKRISHLFQQRFLAHLRSSGTDQQTNRTAMIAGISFSKWLQNILQENNELRKLCPGNLFSPNWTRENNQQFTTHIMAFSLSELKNDFNVFEMDEISEAETQNRLNDHSRKISKYVELSPNDPKNVPMTEVYFITDSSNKEVLIRKKASGTEWTNWLLQMDLDAVLEKEETTDKDNTRTLILKIRTSSSKVVLVL